MIFSYRDKPQGSRKYSHIYVCPDFLLYSYIHIFWEVQPRWFKPRWLILQRLQNGRQADPIACSGHLGACIFGS